MLGTYSGSTAALTAAKNDFIANNSGYTGSGPTLMYTAGNGCRYYIASAQKTASCVCGGISGSTIKKNSWILIVHGFHTEIIQERNDLEPETVWQMYEDQMDDYDRLGAHVQETMKKMEPDYNSYYQDGTIPEPPNYPGLIDALRDVLQYETTIGDTVLVDDTDYNNVINDVNDTQGIYHQVLAALNDSKLDKTNQDKTTPEEIAEGIGLSAVGEIAEKMDTLTEYLQEEPSAEDTEISGSDIPPEITEVDFDDDAWGWFQGLIAPLVDEVDEKIDLQLSGANCTHTLDCGSWGEYSADLCPYEGQLSVCGGVLVGIAGLMGLMAVMGRG